MAARCARDVRRGLEVGSVILPPSHLQCRFYTLGGEQSFTQRPIIIAPSAP